MQSSIIPIFLSKLNIAKQGHFVSVKVEYTAITLRLLEMFDEIGIIKGKFGKMNINLNFYGFIKLENMSKISFLFVNKVIYSSFLKYFFKMYSFILKLYFFRLRLKGLGYRMFKINKNLLKFFFAKNHYYYFNILMYSYVKIRFRNFFIISFNKMF